MSVRKVIYLVGKLVNKWEPEFTLKLSDITNSKSQSHNKDCEQKCKVLEIDSNGTVLLRKASGVIKRYSEKNISNHHRDILKEMDSEDAHDLGYRVGLKEGLALHKQKTQLSLNLKNKILKIIR